jgi:hypothetical protein
VYTEEEVNLERLEKHIFVWKLDLEGGVGESNMHLEALLAKRLMRESALLMQTLRSYAVPELTGASKGAEPVVRGESAKEVSEKDSRQAGGGHLGRWLRGGGERHQEGEEKRVR